MPPALYVPMGDVLGQLLGSQQLAYAEGVIEVRHPNDRPRQVWFWTAWDNGVLRFRVQLSDSVPALVCDGTASVTLGPRGREIDRGPAARFLQSVPGWLLNPSTALIWGRGGEDWKVVTSTSVPVVAGLVRVPLTGADQPRSVGCADVVWTQGRLQRLVLGDSA